jgi:hypothetical protein
MVILVKVVLQKMEKKQNELKFNWKLIENESKLNWKLGTSSLEIMDEYSYEWTPWHWHPW